MSDQYPPLNTVVDSSVPSVARVYDYLLGGKDNFASDRAVAERLIELEPNTRKATQENRKVLTRVVRYLTDYSGVDQFIDIGSGLPTQQNVHEIAHSVIPDAHVVYVDNDPIVLAHGRALLSRAPNTTVVQADMRDPEGILTDPDVTKVIDLSRPVALIFCSVLHHLGEEVDKRELLQRYLSRMPSGSYVFLTHLVRTAETDAEATEAESILQTSFGTGRIGNEAEVTALFDGLELEPPGVVYAPLWRPDEVIRGELPQWRKAFMGGLGRKP